MRRENSVIPISTARSIPTTSPSSPPTLAATGQGWVNGDYNYDGTVNALDFNALATNYGQLLSASALPDQIDVQHDTVVPEPWIALPLLLPSLIQRRCRTNRP